ncbi:hypothetical protein ACOMHN_038508 [Nucella lapillus]
MKQQLSCLSAMSSHIPKPWRPPHDDPERSTEVLSGDLYLITTTTTTTTSSTCKARAVRCPVHVHIYRSCFGHYAVVSANLRTPASFLNLRSCNARMCAASSDSRGRRFRVELGCGEGQVIYFEVSPRDCVSAEEWVRAFQGPGVPHSPGNISPSLSPIIPRNPIMPTLQESIEEEEEEEEVDGELC